MGRGDKERPSWRELDRRRDGGGGRRAGGGRDDRGSPGGLPAGSQKRYRAALDRAFDSGRVSDLVERIERAQAARSPAVNGATRDEAPVGEGTDEQPSAVDGESTARRTAAAPVAPEPAPEVQSQKKLLAKAKGALGKAEITRAVDAYVRRHGWPADYEFLSVALEHGHEEVVAQALDELERMVAKDRPRRAGLLGARLRTLEELSQDAGLRERAAALRKKI